MADFTPDLKRLISKAGCAFERQGKGDHEIWYSPITGKRFVVDTKIKSRHTANGVLKTGGPSEKILTFMLFHSYPQKAHAFFKNRT